MLPVYTPDEVMSALVLYLYNVGADEFVKALFPEYGAGYQRSWVELWEQRRFDKLWARMDLETRRQFTRIVMERYGAEVSR